jgi:hypothetical protein
VAAVTQVRILVTAYLSIFDLFYMIEYKNIHASAGNRTRINCLEGSYADHYTTDALVEMHELASQVTWAIQKSRDKQHTVRHWKVMGI